MTTITQAPLPASEAMHAARPGGAGAKRPRPSVRHFTLLFTSDEPKPKGKGKPAKGKAPAKAEAPWLRVRVREDVPVAELVLAVLDEWRCDVQHIFRLDKMPSPAQQAAREALEKQKQELRRRLRRGEAVHDELNALTRMEFEGEGEEEEEEGAHFEGVPYWNSPDPMFNGHEPLSRARLVPSDRLRLQHDRFSQYGVSAEVLVEAVHDGDAPGEAEEPVAIIGKSKHRPS